MSEEEKSQVPSPPRREPLLSAEFLARLDRLDLVTRKILRGKLKGERRSKQRGSGVEFADYRNYVAGDDLRFIDWNIYGRLDRLFLKLFLGSSRTLPPLPPFQCQVLGCWFHEGEDCAASRT